VCGVFGDWLGRDRETALVVAAVGADVVRQLHLVTVRALFERRHADGEVGATLALTGMRDASLGYTHGVEGSFGSSRGRDALAGFGDAATSNGDRRTDGGV
jgi:hypothetical protein